MRITHALTIGLALPLMGMACKSPTEPLERLVAVEVGPFLTLCSTISPGGGYGYGFGCMNIRELPDGAWVSQVRRIEGFEFTTGYRYRLLVHRPRQLPTDGSDRVYRLWKVIDRESVPAP